MDPIVAQKLEDIKKSMLVFDIETSSTYPHNGEQINIQTNFEDYVKFAKVKWIGFYSYKYNEYIVDEITVENREKIREYIAEHNVLIGFNNEEFDTPIMYNNGLMPEEKWYMQIDMKVILGDSEFKMRNGMKLKGRGKLMGYEFPRNSLREIALAMGLEDQKGDIDYEIFFKDSWTEEERKEIIYYTELDIRATKGIFEKTWDYWYILTDFMSEANVLNLSWLRSSIASVTYKDKCNTLGVEDTYSDKKTEKESMGGRVIQPKYEEARKVWYVDFTSLYPHIIAIFNLYDEVDENYPDQFHSNELFKARGYYNNKTLHPLAAKDLERLKLRIAIKKFSKQWKKDSKTPVPQIIQNVIHSETVNESQIEYLDKLQYTIKIFLNSGYGALRSAKFEQIHQPNAGWDCCWIGQQISELFENMMDNFGFETIAGDTDSIFVIPKDETYNNETYVRECLAKVVKLIKEHSPFPAETYNIDIEGYLEYIMWPFGYEDVVDENGEKNKLIKPDGTLSRSNKKEWRGKKKNYVYIIKDFDGNPKVKITGLAIKKKDATHLGKTIFDEVIEPKIKEEYTAKFEKKWVLQILNKYLQKPGVIESLAKRYKVMPLSKYKSDSQIQAQISQGYFNGQDGVIELLKTKIPGDPTDKKYRPIGRAGKGSQYCTIEEARAAGLTVDDLDLAKVTNELTPFIRRKK